MKIRMVSTYNNYLINETYDVSNTSGAFLVDAGYAEEIHEGDRGAEDDADEAVTASALQADEAIIDDADEI